VDDYSVLRKKGLKRINLRITNTGVVKITAPLRTPNFVVRSFYNDNIEWIEKTVSSKKANREIKDGSQFGVLKVGINSDMEGKYVYEASLKKVLLNDEYNLRESLSAFIESKAKENLPDLVMEMATYADEDVNRVVIKNTTSRWGSCSTKHNINLSKYVWLLPSKAKEYVVAHELAHLKHMNHSAKFWKRVSELDSEYKTSKKILQNHSSLLGCFE